MGSYAPPVDQLLGFGNPYKDERDCWPDYVGLGIGPEHIPDLIRMADDGDLLDLTVEGPQGYGPFHAWRALGVLRAEQAIPTLIRFIETEERDDFFEWIFGELPQVFARIGPASIPELTKLIERVDIRDEAQHYTIVILSEMAIQHPDERAGIVATFIRSLERAEFQDSTTNATLVSNLIDLEAKEAAPVIERAFADGLVDELFCGDWYRVWHDLKLEGEPPPKPERPSSSRSNPSPRSLTPDQRKDRNKARKKLEKKVKGKGKGGKRR